MKLDVMTHTNLKANSYLVLKAEQLYNKVVTNFFWSE